MHVYDLALGGYVFMEVDMQIYPGLGCNGIHVTALRNQNTKIK